MDSVLLHPYFSTPNGSGNVAVDIAQSLQQIGNCTILCSGISGQYRELLAPCTIEVIDIPAPSEFAHWRHIGAISTRVQNTVNELGPDIAVANVFPANWWLHYSGNLSASISTAWYCHEPSAPIHNRDYLDLITPLALRIGYWVLLPWLSRHDYRIAQQFSKLLTNSSFSASRIARAYQRESIVIPPRIQTAQAAEPLPTWLLRPYLLWVGRFDWVKRASLAILGLAGSNRNDLHLVMIGSGPELEECKQLVERYDLSGRVTMIETVPESMLHALISEAAACLSLNPGEGYGMFAAESIYRGTPVIAPQAGALTELIEPDTGFFFDTDSEDSLSQVIGAVPDKKSNGPGLLAHRHIIETNQTLFAPRLIEAIGPVSQ